MPENGTEPAIGESADKARLNIAKTLGDVGEVRARRLLYHFFKTVSPESGLRARHPDRGRDLTAHELWSDPDNDGRPFNFQVKAQTASRRFLVKPEEFENWQCSLCRNEPIFLLFYDDEDTPRYQVRFLSWRKWVLKNADTHAAFTGSERREFSIDVDAEFEPVGDQYSAFDLALRDELEAAKGTPGARSRVISGSYALPVNLDFFVRHLESAPHLWFPEAVFSEMPESAGPQEITRQFLRGWNHPSAVGPKLRELLEDIKRTTRPFPNSFARRQFRKFADAVGFFTPDAGSRVTLPEVNAQSIAYWRTFAAYWPGSLGLFTHLAKNGSRNEQLFSAIILPVFVVAAGANALPMVGQVVPALRQMRDRVTGIHSFDGYRLARESRRGILETGRAENDEESKTIDFMDRYRSEAWELQHLDEYGGGWEGTGAIAKAEQKLTHGTLRDANTREFHAWMRDRLPQMIRSARKRRR